MLGVDQGLWEWRGEEGRVGGGRRGEENGEWEGGEGDEGIERRIKEREGN